MCREDTARLDRLMRELLDLSKIESGAVTPQLVADAAGDAPRRRRGPASTAGGGARRPPRRRCAAGPPACGRGSEPDRTRHRQSDHQRDARHAGRRHDHRGGRAPRRRGRDFGHRHRRGDPARLSAENLRAVRPGAARVRRRRRARPDDLPADRRGARRPAHRPIRAGTRLDVHVYRPPGRERQHP